MRGRAAVGGERDVDHHRAVDEAERAQLCRFTSDLVAHECLGLRVTDFDACTADPPWTGCEGDVAAWESCVAGWQEQGCDARCDAYCAP